MSSNSDNATTLAENKVLILYILIQINGEIMEDNLFKIISSINDINYFYFKQILTDLIDSKLVGIYTKENEQVLKITSEGENAYTLTKDVMPGLLKFKADHVFKREFSNIEEASSIIAEFTPKDEYNYTVTLKIVDNNETIFEVKTFAGSRERAKKIVDNWKNDATSIYPKLLNILFEDNNN